jgi:hypothetical protein
MTYQSAPALRTALERRLSARSTETGVRPGPATPTGDVRTHHRPHTSGRAGAMGTQRWYGT